MKHAATVITAGWEIHEKINPVLDLYQLGTWVWAHVSPWLG